MVEHKTTSGFALPLVLVFFPFIILIAIIGAELALASVKAAQIDNFGMHAQFAADAGVDYALKELNKTRDESDPPWTGTASPVAVHATGSVTSDFEVSISDINDRNKLVTVTGVSHRSGGKLSERKLEVAVRGVGGGSFSVVTGVGGLFMSNSAKILGGNVFVNGEVEMRNTAQIGLESNPEGTEVQVAHQICGTTNYPRVCAEGENGEPISIDNPAQIFADVYANNQTDGSHMSLNGLVGANPVLDTDNPPISPQPLPDHDRQQQIDDYNAANSASGGAKTFNGSAKSCTANNGSVTWEENIKINGDVTISKKCTVTIEGNVWITGELDMRQSGEIVVSNTVSVSDPLPDLMVDDTMSMRNSAGITANSNDIGVRVITYKSTASCSPDCSDVTGSDLQSSRTIPTISLTQQAAGPESLFYARWSQIDVGNGGGVGALIGQTINLNQSAAVTFGTTASDGGPARWVIDTYKRVFN